MLQGNLGITTISAILSRLHTNAILDCGLFARRRRPWRVHPAIECQVTLVGGFSTALALASASDLIASVPERHTGNLRSGMSSFPLPVIVPEITVSLFSHPRLHADPAHRWLRGIVRDACATAR